MADNKGKKVEEVLKGKKASVKTAALDPGSPSWDEIMELTWEEINDRARRNRPGYKTIKKLLGSKEYDK